MSDFVRARTENQFNLRREMILDACDEIYQRDGFLGVTFNTVAAKTSFTRPALYNYYTSKEEMLLELLEKKQVAWAEDIRKAFEGRENLTEDEYCTILTTVAYENRTLFQLLGDIYLIEQGCPLDRVVNSMKYGYSSYDYLGDVVLKIHPDATPKQIERFKEMLLIASFGIFQRTNFNQKQIEAYHQVCPGQPLPEFKKLMYNSLMVIMSIFH